MIKKERGVPRRLQMLEALKRRLPATHPKWYFVEKDYMKSYAGYRGEVAADYHLQFLQKDTYYIFLDLRIPVGEHFMQIDSLIVSSNVIFLLEVKNFSGTLLFDEENQQMIRVLDGKEEGFLHPGLQSQRHQFLLKEWLNQHKFPPIPIKNFIVISNPSTIIKFLSGNPNRNILHAAQVPYKLDLLQNRLKQDVMDVKDLRRLSSLLLKKHTVLQENLLHQYELSPPDLLTGVHCPSCFAFSMIRSRMGIWHCGACSFTCKHAHISSLKDYALLVNEHITKEEMVCFLHLSSSKVSRHIIKKECLDRKGNNRSTTYDLSPILT